MQTLLLKYKLIGSEGELREWGATLNANKVDVMQTLTDEGIVLEFAALDRQDDGLHLLYLLKARDLKHAWKIYEASQTAIDLYRKQTLKMILKKPIALEVLVDFENPDVQ